MCLKKHFLIQYVACMYNILVIKLLVYHFAGVHVMILWPYLSPASRWSHVRKLLLSLIHSYSDQHPASAQHSARTSWMLLTPPTPGTTWHMTAEIIEPFDMRLLTTFTLYSGTDFNHVPWVGNINNVYLQTKLVTGGARDHFTLVS